MPDIFKIKNLKKSNKAVNWRLQPIPTQICTIFNKYRLIYNIMPFGII